ncbi:MAG: hypothetical protein WD775_02270 [Burkholderiales bacterium]
MKSKTSTDRMSFYGVPLVCEAAPRFGCGTRAKPVLRDLERHPGVSEAWLNRAGNLIAIAGSAKGRRAVLEVLRRQRIKAEPLRGEPLEIASQGFASGLGWYRAAEVDRLSEEEARTIARRLTARLGTKTQMARTRINALENAIEAACAHELIDNPAQSAPARKRRLAKAILAAARRHLDDTLFGTFADLVRLGHRPLPGEE